MLAGLVTFRRGELALARGLRGAAAVVLPLVVGAATGHLQYGGGRRPAPPPPRHLGPGLGGLRIAPRLRARGAACGGSVSCARGTRRPQSAPGAGVAASLRRPGRGSRTPSRRARRTRFAAA